ncbi:hypothetical protein TCAL_14441 [Tigriopus californicus]|uniref:Uncharacterized protein n=1 Tax=Tigriopus californicus TaxID=6832 RepID=A0A553PKJ5_TIGCA|nr:putative lysozyme-like protein [Tigriopus californicus]XP_059095126.1 putative lysozyme-like protein [Tigriopus californicus]TRY78207.1 hypothetical protein TCAL_14441 [Tigriopus californicus]
MRRSLHPSLSILLLQWSLVEGGILRGSSEVAAGREVVDDANEAIVVSASDSGSSSSSSIVSPDGPGPSILGSLDNIFGSVKDFDQYQCLEKMLCEYMQTDGDAVSELINRPLSGFQSATATGLTASNPTDTRFAPAPNGPNFDTPNAPFRPPNFQQQLLQQQQPPPRPGQGGFLGAGGGGSSGGGLLSQLGSALLGRKKRQAATSNVQGNIIRLFQATGMDHLNLFPYVRAALIGHATRSDLKSGGGFVRRGSSCQQMYRQCPTEASGVVDYLNNHNGGLFNQVEPSVNQEVAPILSSIVSDVIGGGGTSGTQTQSSSTGGLAGLAGSDSSFGTIDKLISTALINNAAEMLTGGTSSSSSSSSATAAASGGGLSSLLGGSGSSGSGVIGQALSTFTSFVSGKRK